jgi:hypothetical protein
MVAKPPKTLAEALADELAYAMDDIRHKLIEQPGFGQELTGDAVQLDVERKREDNLAREQQLEKLLKERGIDIE